MKNIYLVASKVQGLDAYRRIYGAFEDKALGEAYRSLMEKNQGDFFNGKSEHFAVEFVLVSVNIVEWGSPEANEIMIG